MSSSGIYTSIEQELWRIFTFYALHSDPTQPESIRPANFVRFAKDVQIVSKKLTASAIELEIARHARSQLLGKDHTKLSISLNFADFMQLLEILSVKVYPRDPGDIAAKRLILENVLLLANRRIPYNDSFDLKNAEIQKLTRETFKAGLHGIFEYYLDRAELRRNLAVSNEKSKQREMRLKINMDLDAALPDGQEQTLQDMKALAKAHRFMISYKEYLQFCSDFNLKSTSMLSAIQVGEIFMNIIPLSSTSSAAIGGSSSGTSARSETGMNFQSFSDAILYMALVAYQDLGAEVPAHYKVKALLMYIYKVVIDGSHKMQQLNNDRTSAISSGVKGSTLHLYGSGPFVKSFQQAWQKDGYPDYTKPPPRQELSAASMLRRAVAGSDDISTSLSATAAAGEGVGGASAAAAGGDGDGDDQSVAESLYSSAVSTTVGGPGSSQKKSKHSSRQRAQQQQQHSDWGVTHASVTGNLSKTLTLSPSERGFKPSVYDEAITGMNYSTAAGSTSASAATAPPPRPPFPVSVRGEDLQELLLLRPELTEFLYLEIQNMKLQTARLTKQAAAQQT